MCMLCHLCYLHMPHTIIIWRSFCLNISCLFPEITHFGKLPLKLAVINVRVKRLYFQHFSIVFAVGLAIIGLVFVLIVFCHLLFWLYSCHQYSCTDVVYETALYKWTLPGAGMGSVVSKNLIKFLVVVVSCISYLLWHCVNTRHVGKTDKGKTRCAR